MASTALDRLIAVSNLADIWKEYWPRAKNSSPGVDGITPQQFFENLPKQIALIRSEVKDGYNYSNLRGVSVPKKDPKKFRIICVPTMQDRVLQRALLRVVESKAVQLGISNDVSFGFVKDRDGAKRGTAAARGAAIKHRKQKPWVFKTDISAFFDRIPRNEVIDGFRKSFQLKSLTHLIEGAVGCEVDDKDQRIRRILAENGIVKGRGLRQGMPLSPILSNFLLRNFDKAFTHNRYDLVRYADDLVVLASSREECTAIKELATCELSKLGLELSDEKTEICAPHEPVEFLGMELGLKAGTSSYCLTVSDKQIRKIREQFTDFHDVDFATKEGLDLPKLLRRLENMKAGYRAAYRLADNFETLEQQLDQWMNNCIVKVYSSIFSSDAISRLTRNQRKFLMLPFA
jgi:retron-type reverse transcriptase